MRKLLIGGVAGAAVLAAGGWGLWRAGLGTVEAALDAELARLSARGIAVTHSAREIGGFPFGYAVTLREVTLRTADGSTELRAPWLRTEAGFPAPTRARATLAPEAALTVTPPADAGMGPIGFALISQALALEIPLAGGARSVSAASVSLRAVEGWPGGFLEITAAGLTAELGDGADGVTAVTARADRLLTAFDAPDGAGGVARNDNASTDVAFTLSGRGLGADGLGAFLAGEGRLDASLASASATSGGPAASSSSGPSRLTLRVDGAGVAVDATAAAIRLTRAQAPAGVAEIAALSFGLAAPLTPAPGPQPWAARATLDAATLDAALWAALDPGALLAREPFALEMDLGGEARILAPLDATAVPGQPPAALDTIEVRRLELSGLGAEASASGLLRIVPGQEAPDGALALRVAGWAPVLQALAAMGVIGPDQAGLATLMAQEYGKPDAQDGVFVADVTLSGGVATVNGRPLR